MALTRRLPKVEQRVLNFIVEHHLVSSQQRVLVAVSGGADSVCLLHILFKLREKLGINLHVAHLNHQLRRDESEADAQFVSDLAQRLGIPATVERRDVKGYQTKHRLSLEEAAREVRYTFLAQVAESIGAELVAVGHTLDDNLETILMHLIRGTGTRGLRGLQPRAVWQSSDSSLTIIRPLLEVRREETASYCHSHRLMPRIDTSNLSLSPLRNRIRHQLLPLLQSYNPQIAEVLLRTARIAADEIALLDKEAARVWDEIVQERQGTIILNKKGFCQLLPALQRHLLRTAIEKLLGNLKDIEAHHIEQIMAALTKPAGKRLSLPQGLIFSIEYDKYLVGKDPAALSPFPILGGEFPLKVPGETLLPGWCITAIVFPSPLKEKGINLFTAYFDLNKTGDRLMVRARQRGDRFQPLGINQPKKLSQFMIDAKIPQAWRQQIPLVCSPKHILWVVGWRIDERVKVIESTEKILCLKFERVDL